MNAQLNDFRSMVLFLHEGFAETACTETRTM